MAGKRVTKVEVTARRLLVARLAARRLSPAEILVEIQAAGFDFKLRTVERDLAWIREQWRKEAAGEIEDIKARELAELDEMDRQAAEAYGETMKTIKEMIEEGLEVEEITATRDFMAAARFLAERTKIKARKAAILGIDAGTLVKIGGAGKTDDGEPEPMKIIIEHVDAKAAGGDE